MTEGFPEYGVYEFAGSSEAGNVALSNAVGGVLYSENAQNGPWVLSRPTSDLQKMVFTLNPYYFNLLKFPETVSVDPKENLRSMFKAWPEPHREKKFDKSIKVQLRRK